MNTDPLERDIAKLMDAHGIHAAPCLFWVDLRRLLKASYPGGVGDWVLVPREPTEAMIAHGEGITDFVLPEGFENTVKARQDEMRIAYTNMLAAAPSPPATRS